MELFALIFNLQATWHLLCNSQFFMNSKLHLLVVSFMQCKTEAH